jgi:hypothetical protein
MLYGKFSREKQKLKAERKSEIDFNIINNKRT